MKYLNAFKTMDYNNPANIKVLFQAFLKTVIITESDETVIICNNDSNKNENEPFNAKEFVFNLTGGAYLSYTESPNILNKSLLFMATFWAIVTSISTSDYGFPFITTSLTFPTYLFTTTRQ